MLFYRRKGFVGSCEPEAAFSDLYITLISHCLSIQAATPGKALRHFGVVLMLGEPKESSSFRLLFKTQYAQSLGEKEKIGH